MRVADFAFLTQVQVVAAGTLISNSFNGRDCALSALGVFVHQNPTLQHHFDFIRHFLLHLQLFYHQHRVRAQEVRVTGHAQVYIGVVRALESDGGHYYVFALVTV
jgi:hypothetical protein